MFSLLSWLHKSFPVAVRCYICIYELIFKNDFLKIFFTEVFVFPKTLEEFNYHFNKGNNLSQLVDQKIPKTLIISLSSLQKSGID